MDPLSIGLGLGAGVGGAYAMKLLRERQSEPESLTEALGWAHLVDADKVGGGYAVVVLKDGGLMRGWRFRGPDTSNATKYEVRTLMEQINEALRPLGTGFLLDISAVRRGADTYAAPERCHFPTEGLKFLDDLRRKSYTNERDHYETEYFLTATYLPPKDVHSRLKSAFVEGQDADGVDWETVLKQYRNDTEALARRLSAQLSMEPLGPSGLMTHLHECLTGKSHRVSYHPRSNPYLASELVSSELVGGFKPILGKNTPSEKHIRVISAKGFPNATAPAHMHFLNQLPYAFRWHTRWMPYSRNAAEEQINKREQSWVRKRQGAKALMGGGDEGASDEKLQELSRDQNALTRVEGSAQAKAELAAGEVSYGRYTTTIVVMEEDAQTADGVAGEIVGALGEDAGVPALIETVNATDAFFGSLPGHGSYNIRRPMISSENMADLMPTTGIWPGEDENPSDLIPDAPPLMWAKTEGSTPFRVNLHDEDVGHGFCVGATGAGKSVLVGSMAYQWMRYQNAQVYIFDIGYSHYLLSLLAGGEHYDIGGPTGDARLQPLRRIDDPQYRTFAQEWVEILFDVQGRSLSPEQKEVIGKALDDVAGDSGGPSARTLFKLKIALANSPELQSVVSEYTESGSYGEFLDADTDSIGDGGFQVFEIGHLMNNMGDEIVVPVLYYLFQRIEEQLSPTRPTLIIIEEAWAALMKGLFADKLQEWLATLRKQNGAVFMVAHDPTQFDDDEIRNVEMLVSNMPTRFFLPNPNALSKKAKPVYEDFGLNEREIERLARATKKRDYYYSNPNKGGRMFRLGLHDAELAFMGTAPGQDEKETAETAQEMYDEYGEQWVAPWLRHCGVHEAAEHFEELVLQDEGVSREELFARKDDSGEGEEAPRQAPAGDGHAAGGNAEADQIGGDGQTGGVASTSNGRARPDGQPEPETAPPNGPASTSAAVSNQQT